MDLLISAKEIANRIAELAQEIGKDSGEQDLDFVVVLKGAIYFAADLSRALSTSGSNSVHLHFITAKSYDGVTQGEVKIEGQVQVKDKNVFIIEDILDSGNTLRKVIPYLKEQGASSVKLVCLLKKHDIPDIKIDYLGFQVPNHWVVGYGFDLDQKYRNLPDIRIYKETK
ncbi:MAG: phosphoribosyltransferase family protein [SAR324 cluster bacterium]|nr:phosphoribosyltransferase family protein [SAR324 cluster bacterium]